MIWNRKKREERRALRAAHLVALEVARESYERHRDTVSSTGEGPGYSFVPAASPGREARAVYFDSMGEQGQSAWDTKRLFGRELRGWEEDSL